MMNTQTNIDALPGAQVFLLGRDGAGSLQFSDMTPRVEAGDDIGQSHLSRLDEPVNNSREKKRRTG